MCVLMWITDGREFVLRFDIHIKYSFILPMCPIQIRAPTPFGSLTKLRCLSYMNCKYRIEAESESTSRVHFSFSTPGSHVGRDPRQCCASLILRENPVVLFVPVSQHEFDVAPRISDLASGVFVLIDSAHAHV